MKMKRDTAERVAAAEVEGVTLDQAQSIIHKFLAQIALCPVCDGSGWFIFGRDVRIETKDEHGDPTDERRIMAGTVGSCPRCGSSDPNESGKGDPDFVTWHCVKGDQDTYCRSDRAGAEDRRNGHADCGFRVMLPYEEAE